MVGVIRRGEIWVANLNPPCGQEIGKIRLVLVFQENALTTLGTPMIIILPLTTQVYPAFKHWRIGVTARGRLLKDCQIIVDQPRTLNRSGFGEGSLAMLSEAEMETVERAFPVCAACFITLFIHVKQSGQYSSLMGFIHQCFWLANFFQRTLLAARAIDW